jgi:multiple sugar transport system permease protein
VHQRTEAEKKARNKKILKRNIIGTAMASPPFIGFLCFTMFPMLVSLYMSLHELHSYNMSYAVFVGFDNFGRIFDDPMLYTAIGNTLYYCLSVPINLVFQVFLAHTLSKKLVGGKIAKIIMFMPQVCSGVAVTLMWQWIFEANYGVINTVLSAIGLPKIGFMVDKDWFMPSVLLISLWSHGTNIVLLESAFVNVNKSLQEAARIDGANLFQIYRKVLLPLCAPALATLAVTTFMESWNDYL